MAGSTISGGSSSGSTENRKTGGGGNKTGSKRKNHTHSTSHPGAIHATGNGNGKAHTHDHSNGAAAAAASAAATHRVTIDVRKIQTNVYANEGGRLSELAVRNWLRSVGFHPEAGGRTWLGDIESISRLDKSEIVRAERLHRAG